MNKQAIICCVVVYFSSYVACIQIANNNVQTKTRHTKYSTSTPVPGSGSLVTPANPASEEGVAFYRVTDTKGTTCILLKTDALIEINFESNIGEEKGDTYIPNSPMVEGECKDDEAKMRISWNGYQLIIEFAKTPGGERWFIENVELTVSTDLVQYRNIRTQGNLFKLYNTNMLIPTPVGKSYNCEETLIDLTPKATDPTVPTGLSGTIFFRAFQAQPFMYKGADFGPTFECNAAKTFRDETAPIAVGSTLAIAVLLTITGYAAFRYFKVKKVQYNTME